MNHTYLRGDMYYADLGHGIGSEQEGYRPIVIIQNDVGNKHSPTVIIASITSKKDAKPKLPTHYYIDAENGLELPSIVLLEQLRTEMCIRDSLGSIQLHSLDQLDFQKQEAWIYRSFPCGYSRWYFFLALLYTCSDCATCHCRR